MQSIEGNTLIENAEMQRVQKSAHYSTEGTLSSDIQRLSEVWGTLPENVRVAILALAGINLEKKME